MQIITYLQLPRGTCLLNNTLISSRAYSVGKAEGLRHSPVPLVTV